jgi:hypothetical protein
MSSLPTHPEDGLLLRYLDGELPGRKLRQVRGHLEACWQCRSAVDDLSGSIAACVQYRRQVLQAFLPPPPAPWGDLADGFARIDAEVGAASWLAGWVGRALAGPTARRWVLSAAAALLLAAGIYYQFRSTPSVEAAALLKRAVAVAETHRTPARPLRLRTSVKNRAAVPGMLRAARYNPDDPLSARVYQEWRNGLAARRDEVAMVPSPDAPAENWYRIRTTAPEGDLAVASLMLRATDLHPVEGRFEFRNQEWIEFSEVSDASTTDGGTPADTRLERSTRQVVPPSRPAAPSSGSSASISEELRVIAALHEIGADLGDPVEVNRSGGRVLVSGIGVAPDRQRAIHRALDPLPNVTVDFSEPAAAAVTADPALGAAAGAAPADNASALQSRVQQQVGGRAEFERFSGQLLDAMDTAMARAYALRALAQRFPDDTGMSAADRGVLTDLAREHTRVLSSQVSDLRRTLAPVLVSLGGVTAQGRPANPGVGWQAAAEDVFRGSRRVEVLLSTVLGVTPEPVTGRVPSDLLQAFAELRSSLDQLSGLL